jgi:hypothetical protein
MHAEFWTFQTATTLFAYVMAVGFLGLFLVVIWKIATDRINLGTVILEKDGSDKASISRFQLLVFTLTIAGLYVILSVEAGTMIDVPNGALALLGISGGSFLVSKGIGTPEGRVLDKATKIEQTEKLVVATKTTDGGASG